jgi:DNA-binding NarL/FixJ family response regulator
VKILVVDDHPLVRDAMASILQGLSSSLRVLQAADCATALRLARAHRDLDLVLLDLNLPGSRGFDALDRIRREHPALPVVILSMFRDRQTVLEAIQRGAMGFIPKAASREVILKSARQILAGGVYVPPEAVTGASAAGGDAQEFVAPGRGSRSLADLRLTPRQGQVLALIMRGKSNKEICQTLGLAERTVKVHVTAVLTALKVSSRTQAVIAARQLGLSADDLLAARVADE